jgi:hypothetical protein
MRAQETHAIHERADSCLRRFSRGMRGITMSSKEPMTTKKETTSIQ